MNENNNVAFYVTRICNNNGLTKKQIEFLTKCIHVQLSLQRGFTSRDFPEMTDGCFRTRVCRLKEFIQVEVKSFCCSYRVKGVPLNSNEGVVTDDPMGDKLILMLTHIKEQPAAIHNIKIRIEACLHKYLLKLPGIKMEPSNKAIIFDYELIRNYRTRISVYPNTVQIDIACTYNPLVYNVQGAFLLNSLLTLIHKKLNELCDYPDKIPNFNDWVITHYHFGRDGKEEWNGGSFHITVKNALNQLVRYYSKMMLDKKRYGRVEVIKTPRIKVSEELEKMSTPEVNTEFVN